MRFLISKRLIILYPSLTCLASGLREKAGPSLDVFCLHSCHSCYCSHASRGNPPNILLICFILLEVYERLFLERDGNRDLLTFLTGRVEILSCL